MRLSQSRWWGSEEIGAFTYKGEFRGLPALLKVQGVKPETSEAFMIESFERANRSQLVRPPRLYFTVPWSDTDGFEALILEYINGSKVVSIPCTEAELDIAKLDGCRIIWLAAPQGIKGTDGNVSQLICRVMKLGEPDASGRRSPVETAETFTLDVDMVIKAAGQIPFEHLVTSNQLKNANGKITIAPDGATNIKGVFAGGDCVNGGKEVVDAVQAGKVGAAAILEHLRSNMQM